MNHSVIQLLALTIPFNPLQYAFRIRELKFVRNIRPLILILPPEYSIPVHRVGVPADHCMLHACYRWLTGLKQKVKSKVDLSTYAGNFVTFGVICRANI